MSIKKNKKKNLKDKLMNVLKSYKTIIYISFFINIILLIFSYNLMISNHEYTFSGSNEYIKIKDGLILLNNDLNIFYGNNIEYINEKDYEIESLNLGYYVINNNNNNYKKIVNKSYSFEDESMFLSEIISDFVDFNIMEKNSTKNMFTQENVKLLKDGLYFILEAKTIDNEDIKFMMDLNISKISKF